jgi:hypothetical protein
MAPINLPNGNEVSEIVLPNGASASEVIAPDGSTVFSAIPDKEDLHARYDATKLSLSDGDSVSTWEDATGNGYDLIAERSPTYKTDILNNNSVVQFDSDLMTVDFSTLSQPNTIVFVGQQNDGDDYAYFYDTNDSNNRHAAGRNNGSSWRSRTSAGSIAGGSFDTNYSIFTSKYDGQDSVLRRNGSQIASGDLGGDGLNGYRVGDNVAADNSSTNNPLNGAIAEILIYQTGLDSQTISDAEQFLSDKWGVTV